MTAPQRLIAVTAALSLVLFAASCGSKSKKKKKKVTKTKAAAIDAGKPVPKEVVSIQAIEKKMCACADKACAVAAQKQFNAIMSKPHTPEVGAAVKASAQKVMTCYMRVVKATATPTDGGAPTKKRKAETTKLPIAEAIDAAVKEIQAVAIEACKCNVSTCRRTISTKLIAWRTKYRRTPPGPAKMKLVTAAQKKIQKCFAKNAKRK